MKPNMKKLFTQICIIACATLTDGIAMGQDDGMHDRDWLLPENSQKNEAADSGMSLLRKEVLNFFVDALPRDIPLLGGLFNFHLVTADTHFGNKTIIRTIQYRLYMQTMCQRQPLNVLTHKLVTMILRNKCGSPYLKIIVYGYNSEFNAAPPFLLHRWGVLTRRSTLKTVKDVIEGALKTELFIIICMRNYRQHSPLVCARIFGCKFGMFEARPRTLRISPVFVLLKCGHCFHKLCLQQSAPVCGCYACPLCLTPIVEGEILMPSMPIPKNIAITAQDIGDDLVEARI
ncbi:MAG: hypothetical protein WCW33_02730 [Candidatus Babeliales bacterium]|jgi:hypothetical protein